MECNGDTCKCVEVDSYKGDANRLELDKAIQKGIRTNILEISPEDRCSVRHPKPVLIKLTETTVLCDTETHKVLHGKDVPNR